MILQGLGPCQIARLLRAEREREPVSDWLLFGPTDPDVVEPVEPVEPETPVFLLAAE
ncbi:MAG: hypothetical protein Q7U20_04755 [Caulobacter sp.]|nr:hypothetical protein [Caulobacter sp.]